MFNTGFGDSILDAKLDNAPTMANGVTSLTTLASQDDQGNLYVALVNVDRDQDRQVRLEVPGVDLTGRELTVQTLASQSITDENTLEHPDNVSIQTTQTVSSAAPVVSVPKHSFVVVQLSKAQGPTPEPTPEPTLQPTPEVTPTPQPSATPSQPQPSAVPTQPGDSVPPTGDSAPLWPAAALVFSVGGLLLLGWIKRRS